MTYSADFEEAREHLHKALQLLDSMSDNAHEDGIAIEIGDNGVKLGTIIAVLTPYVQMFDEKHTFSWRCNTKKVMQECLDDTLCDFLLANTNVGENIIKFLKRHIAHNHITVASIVYRLLYNYQQKVGTQQALELLNQAPLSDDSTVEDVVRYVKDTWAANKNLPRNRNDICGIPKIT